MRSRTHLPISLTLGATLLAAYLASSSYTSAAVVTNNRQADDLSSLMDALSVAKSPLEPVTIASETPKARNDESTTQNLDAISEDNDKSTTRQELERDMAGSTVDESTSPPDQESTTAKPESTTTGSADEAEATGSTAKSNEQNSEGASTTTLAPTENSATSTEKSASNEGSTEQPAAISTTASPTGGEESSVEAAAKPDEPKSDEPKVLESKPDEPKPEEPKPDEPKVEEPKPEEPKPEEPKPEEPKPEEPKPEEPKPEEPKPEEPKPEEPKPEEPKPEEPKPEEPKTEEPKPEEPKPEEPKPEEPKPEEPKPEAPAKEEDTARSKPETESTTTSAPVSSTEPPESSSTRTESEETPSSQTTAAPTTTTRSSEPSSTTPIPESEPPKRDQKESSKPIECSHLPTYEPEELQRVFREETTYRNGTIKGKFTYVSFDQRYRLVHYTRLPYAPVKIDQVDELGKPDNSSGQPSMVPSSPLTPFNGPPNSVLQLRNVLPNFLFGFPFVNQNLGSRSQGPAQGSAADPRDTITDGLINANLPSANPFFAGPGQPNQGNQNQNDKNMYFYSTEALLTPNLLSTSVPISMPPSQRRANMRPQFLGVDTLSQSLNQRLPDEPTPGVVGRKLEKPAEVSPSVEHAAQVYKFAGEQQQHFEVSHHSPEQSSISAGPEHPVNNQQVGVPALPRLHPVLSYPANNHGHQQPPLSFYSFHQPNYFSNVPQSQQPASYRMNIKHEVTTGGSSDGPLGHSGHQTHQPHSHEHYIAPFMYTQTPAAMQNDQAENSRLKLKVKTSKSLPISNDSGRKSAKIRLAPGQYPISGPVNSPAQVRRLQQQQQQQQQPRDRHQASPNQPRHRAGKQNQDLKQTVNTSPVVYHVMRSPVSHLYNAPRYHDAHALAYNHEI